MLNYFLKSVLAVTLISIMSSVFSVEDCGIDGVCRNYPADFGQILVGEASVREEAIASTVSMRASLSDSQFAFMGVDVFSPTVIPLNQWASELINSVAIQNPDPSNSIGMFFAPASVGQKSASLLLISSLTANNDERPSISGTGVADTGQNINMNAEFYRRPPSIAQCITAGGVSSLCEKLPPPLIIHPNDNISFIVMPTIKSNPSDYSKKRYVKLLIRAVEQDGKLFTAKCTPVAKDKIPLNLQNKPVGEGTIEFISQFGPLSLDNSICYRKHDFFIAEAGKKFEFQTTVTGMPTTRSIDYLFYAEGHETTTTGNVSVKLSLDGGTTTPTTPSNTNFQMNVSVDGNGTISSDDIYKINCSTNCQATVPSGTSLTLTANANAQQGSTFTKWDCTGTTSTTNPLIVTMDTAKSCKATFTTPTTPTTPVVDKACFTVEYIDDRVDFAKDEIRKVKLDASCSGTYNQYKWHVYSTNSNTDSVLLPTTQIFALHDQFSGKILPDGNYIVTLIVGEGETQDQISQNLTIPPLLAKFKTSSDSQKVGVDATSLSKSKDSGTISYQWWIGYLGRITPDIPGITMSPSQNQLTIDYAGKSLVLTGNYYETITLAITDSKGRVSTISQKAKVNLPAPVTIDDFSFVGNPTTNTDGTITITLKGQATDPDGGIVSSYTFTDSYGHTAAKVEPQVDANGKAWQQATFNYASQKTIADAYLLQVSDNEVGNDQTTASKILRLALPKLTSATINNKGTFGNTSTIFHGGVSVDGGKTYQTPVAVTSTQQLAIRGYFEVDSADIKQLADILLIVGTESQLPFDGGADTTYVSFGATGFNFIDLYQSPDVWMAQLTNPFVKSVTLAKEMPLAQNLNLQLFTGTPAFFQWQPYTQLYFFLGYRLLDSKSEGKIVYSSQPITLKIEP